MMRKTIAFAAGMLVLPVFALSAQTRGGLTKVELLALQQEMRDQGCGNKHAAGEWDAATKGAIRTCAKKYNASTNAKELLAAMNIGFSAGDTPPVGGAVKSGEPKAEEAKASPGAEKAEMKPAARKTTGAVRTKRAVRTKGAVTMKHDSTMMKHDSTMMKHDSTIKQDTTIKH